MNILTPWSDYFVAQAGAAGALTGLIFVALSFNFDQIISDEVWLGRAGTGLILLAQPIAYALVCLWPARTASPPGWTTAALAALAAVIVSQIVLRRPGRAPAGTRPGRSSWPRAPSSAWSLPGSCWSRSGGQGPSQLPD